MVEKLVPVPLAGEPPVAVQLNVYGVVPPVADAVHETAVLTVALAGQVMVATSASGLMAIVADAVAVFAFASVAVTLTVKVPLTLYVVVNDAPVPLAGDPPVAVQANV